MPESRDFSTGSSLGTLHEKSTEHGDIDVEAARTDDVRPAMPTHHKTQETSRSDRSRRNSAPILRHRKSHGSTYWGTFPAVVENPRRPAWEPGQEPGLDPSVPDGGREQVLSLRADCDITVVDYSEDDMVMRHLTNESLLPWIERAEKMEKEGGEDEWVKCRWINVNGLSWDVIQALGKYKKFHRLAIEDMVNTKNRTKVDWYSDHTYIVLTLQKLVKLPSDSDSDSDSDGEGGIIHAHRKSGKVKKGWSSKLLDKLIGREMPDARDCVPGVSDSQNDMIGDHIDRYKCPLPQLRTLQRYHGGPNVERMSFMENNSAMTRKNLAVCAEQVSIFLLSSNTVISFFESSADDIETPIIKRLATPETILRRSCDASMLAQSIIDAIIDLAMPIAAAYSDIIQELELEVLTEPSIRHTRELYILTSETTTMRNFVSPIATLVRAIREHTVEPIGTSTSANITSSPAHTPSLRESGIKISIMAYTYLGDVEDHCISILSELDQIATSASGMISLIFNTVSAYQNESMRQLTIVTIIFLPLTFITGYFGMNFEPFAALQNDPNYFWSIAAPVAIGTGLLLMREVITRWVKKWIGKWGRRRRRLGRERREKEKMQWKAR